MNLTRRKFLEMAGLGIVTGAVGLLKVANGPAVSRGSVIATELKLEMVDRQCDDWIDLTDYAEPFEFTGTYRETGQFEQLRERYKRDDSPEYCYPIGTMQEPDGLDLIF